jgi:hypothetical protein
LLSVVAQPLALLVFIYLCAGEYLAPSSNDADEGWQWEIQIDENWVSYLDSQAYVVRGGPLSSRTKSVWLSRETNDFAKTLIIV